jgi:hypothetical protein
MTIDKTIQNFWRLPSISELIAKAASDPTSFHYDRYWSISLDTKGSATTHDQLKKSLDSTGASSFTSDYSSDHNGGYVRCIQ